MVNSPYYDRYDRDIDWAYRIMPINPPIDPAIDRDVSGKPYVYPWYVTEIPISNWDAPYFQPRLRDNVQLVSRTTLAAEGEADELDFDSEDEYYDSAFN